MDRNATAKRIIRIRNRQSKLTALMHHYAAQLVALDAELCDLLTDCIDDAGLDEETASAARASKDGGG